MSAYVTIFKREFKPKLDALRDDIAKRKDKDFFWPTGTQVYVGLQGSGKTISAVYHARKFGLRYRKMITVSNLALKWLKPCSISLTESQLQSLSEVSPRAAETERKKLLAANLRVVMQDFDNSKYYVFFTDIDELMTVLTGVNNDFFGVLYLIDEIHTYFNALDSKNIPVEAFTEISQQRKQRKAIIGTSQLFMRMAKPFREQADNMIVCKTRWGVLTHQTAYRGTELSEDADGHLLGVPRRKGFFWQTRKSR